MVVANTPADIAAFQIIALKGAVKLEMLGMKRRGRAATVIAREQFNLPKSMSKSKVYEFLVAKVEELIKAREAECVAA